MEYRRLHLHLYTHTHGLPGKRRLRGYFEQTIHCSMRLMRVMEYLIKASIQLSEYTETNVQRADPEKTELNEQNRTTQVCNKWVLVSPTSVHNLQTTRHLRTMSPRFRQPEPPNSLFQRSPTLACVKVEHNLQKTSNTLATPSPTLTSAKEFNPTHYDSNFVEYFKLVKRIQLS